jgi:hypothetical protein
MCFFRDKEKEDLINWIFENNKPSYLEIFYYRPYSKWELSNMSKQELKAKKESMISKHLHFINEKNKPKVGKTYEVYIHGRHTTTLSRITNVSKNENGVFFTETKEDGSVKMHSYFGNNINWSTSE